MKHLLFFIPLLALSFTVGNAQESETALPESDMDQSDVDPFGGRLQLIPDSPATDERPEFGLPDPPTRESLEPEVSRETRRAVEKQERAIAMKRARIHAEKNEGVRQALEQSETADTDAERRYALTLYYNRLYDLMLKSDPSLKDEIEKRRSHSINQFAQKSIRPSHWEPGTE